MPLDLTDDKSTLVQVMAWCRQATSLYLRQCWPRFLSPYGVTRPQWVKIVIVWNLAQKQLSLTFHRSRSATSMMTSSNGNIFRVTGHLCGEFIGPRWIPVNSPHKGHWRGALMFSLICVWINGLVNNREAADLRHYRAHCDVTVMPCLYSTWENERPVDAYMSGNFWSSITV